MAAKQRFPWVTVSAVVAAGVVSIVAWLRVPEYSVTPSEGAHLPALGLTQINAARSKQLLAEQLAAYDPTPLFIPSPMNSHEPPITEDARSRASGPFTEIRPELTKTGPLKFPPPVVIPDGPVGGLRLTERPTASLALTRDDEGGGALKTRLARVEAVTAADGRVVLAIDLPFSTEIPPGDWQPLELAGSVNRAGLLGELVVTASSGSGEIDDYFRSLLAKNLRIGARLSEGFYAFRVGP
jgi:hypothetical protein